MAKTSRGTLIRSILLRLLYGVLSLFFISLITFWADELAPGDQALALAGEKARPEAVLRLREQLGLNRPWPVRYGEYVVNAAKLDFGRSYFGTKEPVSDKLKRALPLTMRVAFLSILLAAAIGILLGTAAAIYENRFADRAVLTLSTLGVTVPNFVLAPILVLIFALNLNYLPTTWEVEAKRVAPDIYYLILPVVVLAARPMAALTRLTRASMVDTLRQEFIKLAVAKGVPRWRVYFKHALRNAILPVMTAIGTSFGFLLTGSFTVETIFAIPGLGSEAILAIRNGDKPMIMATVLVSGALFIVINLIVDILLPIIDPRIRESQV